MKIKTLHMAIEHEGQLPLWKIGLGVGDGILTKITILTEDENFNGWFAIYINNIPTFTVNPKYVETIEWVERLSHENE